MSKKNPLENFDPNAPAGQNGHIFGLPFDESNADLILLPVPWEVTVSYHPGTSRAVFNILEASKQVDLFDLDSQQAWKKGIFMIPPSEDVLITSDHYRRQAEEYIEMITHTAAHNSDHATALLASINQANQATCRWVYERAVSILGKGKKLGLIGGDHSTPLGYLYALAEKYESFGILHIDAHCDLRKAYEGFELSHASIMYNALENIPQIEKLVPIGIRDFCEEEYDYMLQHKERISCFFDNAIRKALFEGATWEDICTKIVEELPRSVYISFDVDGLDPKLCPNTGTPVPGGFDFAEIDYLIHRILAADRQIIGFDLSETGIGENDWDANVSARILWKLCNRFLSS